jgi:hypothetical protein
MDYVLMVTRESGPAGLGLRDAVVACVKQFGVGLAVAILIDVTIVRGVLLPPTMKLLGERNWYLTRWLEWLRRFKLGEPSPAPEAPPALVSAQSLCESQPPRLAAAGSGPD